MAHSDPKHILIVGGGDGGVLREVCRYPNVESITLVEIDQKVIDVAKMFFSESTATSFDDERLTIVNQDAAEFLEQQNNHSNDRTDDDHHGKKERCGYDVIVADTSDPVGPAESLFDPAFYEQMHEALDDGGVICAQGECYWTHPRLIENVVACCSDIFDSVEYASTYVPTYPCGQIGFILASKGDVDLRKPSRKMTNALQHQLQWYTPAIHSASFILPKFLEDKLALLRPSDGDAYDDNDEDEEEGGDCFLRQCVIS